MIFQYSLILLMFLFIYSLIFFSFCQGVDFTCIVGYVLLIAFYDLNFYKSQSKNKDKNKRDKSTSQYTHTFATSIIIATNDEKKEKEIKKKKVSRVCVFFYFSLPRREILCATYPTFPKKE